jgi:tryptophan synthase alpha chain
MSERLRSVFETDRKLLSIFVTAGFPSLDDTVGICEELQAAGVDFIELGLPFSDSIADGPTIQDANTVALENGMTVSKALAQLKEIRQRVSIPIVLMGSINPVLRYGVENFCEDAVAAGADGTIFPDLPAEYFKTHYRSIFESRGLSNIFLVAPSSDDERIRLIDEMSDGFIYVVSSPGVTGGSVDGTDSWKGYLDHLNSMGLKSPLMVGFGIENGAQMERISEKANGVIVGSAFIRALVEPTDTRTATREFIKNNFPNRTR